jgi:6-phosphogluconolactonase
VRLIVGTYARLGGHGLVQLTVRKDELVVGPRLSAVADASFGVRSRAGRTFLAVEQAHGQVVELHDLAGGWRSGSSASTAGAAPCHLALDPAEWHLAVANYESGSVALFRIDGAAPLPAEPLAHCQLSGRGPNEERQAGPHAHWVGFDSDGRWLYAVDLGTDRVLRFRVDGDAPRLGRPETAYRAPAGTGPRHLAFHPTLPFAFLVSELASTLTVLRVSEDGRLDAMEILSTLPTGADESLGGAIAINAAGDRLYVTNRGHDSIAVFGIAASGAVLMQHVPSGGASPRFLLLLEQQRRLLVANEEGGTVWQFGVEDDGRLTPIGAPAEVPGAVFLAVA